MIEQLLPWLILAAVIGRGGGIPAIVREIYAGRTKLFRAKRGDPEFPDIVIVAPPYTAVHPSP